jgi:hypothetical protein
MREYNSKYPRELILRDYYALAKKVIDEYIRY